jgi:hypothetical protein
MVRVCDSSGLGHRAVQHVRYCSFSQESQSQNEDTNPDIQSTKESEREEASVYDVPNVPILLSIFFMLMFSWYFLFHFFLLPHSLK